MSYDQSLIHHHKPLRDRDRCRRAHRHTKITVSTLIATSLCLAILAGCAASTRQPLLVADLHSLSGENRITFTALEGLVNRTAPQVYLTGFTEPGTDLGTTADTNWLHDAVDLPQRQIAPMDLITHFKNAIRGLVVWDPRLLVDTENVATTMAGLDDALPVSPQMAAVLESPPYNLKIISDLRRQNFQSRSQAYSWALGLETPQHRFAFPAWIGDDNADGKGDEPALRDWIVANGGFAFEADPGSDQAVISQVLSSFPTGTPVYGYIFYGDAAYKKSGIATLESVGVSEISRAGDFLVPSVTATNLTVFSHLSSPIVHPPWDDSPVTPSGSQVYVTFIISDGDNIDADQAQLLLHRWSEPERGRIPMGISLSLQLPKLAPTIYDYYMRTRTNQDVFVAAPSGAGYAYPSFMPDIDQYLSLTRQLMTQAGLHAVWVLDDGYATSPSQQTMVTYARALGPSAIFTDYLDLQGDFKVPNPPALSFADGVPVVHDIFGLSIDQVVTAVRATGTAAGGKPAFVFIGLDTWNMGYADAVKVMDELGPGYQAVRPDTFVGLLKGAHSESVLPAGETTP